MELMETWYGAAMTQPHPVTLSGGLVHFQTDMDGLMQITGTGNITVCGKNLFGEVYPNIDTSATVRYRPIYIGGNVTVTLSTNIPLNSGRGANLFLLPGNVNTGASTTNNGVIKGAPRTTTASGGYITIGYRGYPGADPVTGHTLLEVGTSATTYEKYTGTTAPAGTARKSLVGINNVWSDSGNVTVTYWTH